MKRLLPFVVLIVLLIAGILAVPFLLRPESHRAEITDRLSKLLHRPVVIGSLSMSYWPPALKLEKIAVMKESGEPAMQIQSVVAPLDWKALFRLQFAPSELQLNQWVLTTQRRADGSWDLEDWFSGKSASSGGKTWTLQQVRWKDGEIQAVDPYGPAYQALTLASIEGSWDPNQHVVNTSGLFTGIGAPAKLTLTAKGQFLSPPQWSGDFQLTDEGRLCAFHIENGAGKTVVKGESAQWKLSHVLALLKFYGRGSAADAALAQALMLDNWHLQIDHTSGPTGMGTGVDCAFTHSAGISGGVSEIQGTLHSGSPKPGTWLKADGALKDVPVGAVLALHGLAIPLEGKVTAVAKGVEMTVLTHTLSSLSGQGFFQITGGRYRPPQTALLKLSKAKTMPYARKKFPDLETQGLPIAKISVQWDAKDGMVNAAGSLASSDLKAAWAGKLDVARQGLDGFLRLQIQEKNAQLRSLIPVKYRTESAYGRLQGSWQEWTLRAVPASKVPSSAQAKLRRAISQK